MADIFDINKPLNFEPMPEFKGLNNVYLNNQNLYNATQNSRNTTASKNPTPNYETWKKKQVKPDENAFNKIRSWFAQNNKGQKISPQAVSDLWQDLDADERVLFQLNPKKFIENRITNQPATGVLTEPEKREFAYKKYIQYMENGQEELANSIDEKWKFTDNNGDIQKKLDMFQMWKDALAKYKISRSFVDKAEMQMWADALFDKGMRISSDGKGGFTLETGTDMPEEDDVSMSGANVWFKNTDKDSKTWRDISDQKLVNSKTMRELMDMTDNYNPEFLTIYGKWKGSKLNLEQWLSVNGQNLSTEERAWLENKTKFGVDSFMMFNAYVKFITGAQMSEKEVQRLRKAMPSLEFSGDFSNFFLPEGDSPIEFETKMDKLTEVTRDSYSRFNFLTDDNIFQTLIKDGIIPADEVEKAQKNYDSDRENAFYRDDMNNTRFNTKRNYLFTSEEVGLYRQKWKEQHFEKAKKELLDQKKLHLPEGVDAGLQNVGLTENEKVRLMFESSVASFNLFGMEMEGGYPFTLKEKQLYQQYGLLE